MSRPESDMLIKRRNVFAYYIGAVALNAPFIIFWTTMIGVDACRMSGKSSRGIRFLSSISVIAFAVLSILVFSEWFTFHDEVSTLENPNLFALAVASGLLSVLGLLAITIVANRLITKREGYVPGALQDSTIVLMFILAYLSLPYLQSRLNRLARSDR